MILSCRVHYAFALEQLTFLVSPLLKDSFIAVHHFGAHHVFSVAILTLNVMSRSFQVIILLTNCEF